MQFDMLVYRETGRPGRSLRLTVDFRIGEITAQSAAGGEVMWCRLVGPRGDVLRTKLDACDFDAWDASPAPDGNGPGWTLDLCLAGQPVRHLGGDGVPEQWSAFAPVVDLCFSFAENRAPGQCAPASPDRSAVCF